MKIGRILRVGSCLSLLALSSACATLEERIISPIANKVESFMYEYMISQKEREELKELRGKTEESILKYRELKDTQPEIAKEYLELAIQRSIMLWEYPYMKEVFRDINEMEDADEYLRYNTMHAEIFKHQYIQPRAKPSEIERMIREKAGELVEKGEYYGAFMRYKSISDFFEMRKTAWRAMNADYDVKKCLLMKNTVDKLYSDGENPFLNEYIKELEEKSVSNKK